MTGQIKATRTHVLQYTNYRDSGVEWLGEIPAHWELARLWRLSSAISGATPTKDNPVYWNGKIPWVSPKDMKLRLIDTSRDLITQRALEETGIRLVEPGAVLIVVRGMILAHSFPVAVTTAQVTINQDMKALRLVDGLDTSYFAWTLEGLARGIIATVVEEAAHGTRAIRMDRWRNVLFPLPPYTEQRAIAAFLDRETAEIDGLVAKKDRLIELLQEKRAALVTRAVARGLDPNVAMEDSQIEWLGQIPKHWQVKKLSWLTKCLDGKRVPLNAEERGRMQGRYPYWGANSIVDHLDQWLFDEELVLLGEDGAPFFDKTRPVAFAVGGRIWVNNHAHVLRPLGTTDYRFLAHALNSVDYRAFIGGSTRDKLTQGAMRGIPVPCPAVQEQDAIATYLDRETARFDELVSRIRQAIDHLNELRTALISAAVTGKIDVREAA